MRFRNQVNRRALLRILWVLSPCILAVIIVLPRLLSPQFGLLCDGNTLQAARQIRGGNWQLWDLQNRRSRPIYWAFWYFVDVLANQDPMWFYILQTVLLIFMVAALILLIYVVTKNTWRAWLTGVLFVLSGPIIETFYTLSKSEHLALLLLIISLTIGFNAWKAQVGRKRWLHILLIALFAFMAASTKETAIVVLPISAVWLFVLLKDHSVSATIRSKDAEYFLASVIASGCFLIMRSIMVGADLIGSGYSDQYEFSLSRLLSSGSRWAGWLIHDFAYTLPLILLLIIWVLKREKITHGRILVMSAIWMGGWLSIYLFWVFVADYYLLPFAAGMAIFSAAILFNMIERWRAGSSRGFLLPAVFIIFTILLFITIPNNITLARQQLKVDAANSRLLDFLAQELEPNQQLIVNIPAESEYIEQISLQLFELHSLDVEVIAYEPGLPQRINKNDDSLIISPTIENQVLLSPRLGIYELVQIELNEILITNFGNEWKPVSIIEEEYRIFTIDLPRIFCPLVEKQNYSDVSTTSKAMSSMERYCSAAPLVDRQPFTYRWVVFQQVE